MSRETLRNDEYWQRWIDECIDCIREREQKLALWPRPEKLKVNAITQNMYYDRKRLIYLKYSGGVPVAELECDYPKLIEAWEDYNRNISTGDNKKHLLLAHDYHRVLTLISWGIVFDVPAELFQRIANHIHSNGEDALIETLLSAKLKDRVATDKLVYPKIFGPLYRATQAEGIARESLVREYLDSWYLSMKDFINYDAHKAKGEGGFQGYWAFETAAVVALFGIDDSQLKGMDYYPKDMADFARERA